MTYAATVPGKLTADRSGTTTRRCWATSRRRARSRGPHRVELPGGLPPASVGAAQPDLDRRGARLSLYTPPASPTPTPTVTVTEIATPGGSDYTPPVDDSGSGSTDGGSTGGSGLPTTSGPTPSASAEPTPTASPVDAPGRLYRAHPRGPRLGESSRPRGRPPARPRRPARSGSLTAVDRRPRLRLTTTVARPHTRIARQGAGRPSLGRGKAREALEDPGRRRRPRGRRGGDASALPPPPPTRRSPASTVPAGRCRLGHHPERDERPGRGDQHRCRRQGRSRPGTPSARPPASR